MDSQYSMQGQSVASQWPVSGQSVRSAQLVRVQVHNQCTGSG